MSGFFKKLFNRITGKPDTPAPASEAVALPAPEPAVPEPLEHQSASDIVPELQAPAAEPDVSAPEATAPAEAATEVRRPATKAAAQKAKPVAKPAAKPETKKLAPAKAGSKKTEQKKPDPKAVTAKKVTAPVAPVKAAPKPKAVAPAETTPPAPPPVPVKAVAPVEEIVTVPNVVPAAAPAPAPVAAPPAETPKAKSGWLSRLTQGLSKSSKSITGSITAIFTKRKLDAETLQDLEDTLIQADLGVTVSERIIKAVSQGRYDKEIDPEEVKQILASEVGKVLKPVEVPFNFGAEKPFVILVVGVNGSGKTTTIGKLGAIAAGEGFKVKFAACDTFRAAAIEQLTVWGKRIGAETVSRPPGSDAAGLAFDAMKSAKEDGTDIVFIDTAGRLHNKTYLMDELDKVVRVIRKYDEAAPHAVLLVLDATTGQNALAQAEAFTKVAGVTGLIMTKLDGTARGGILVAIAERFKLPIHAIGVGESIEDLQPFDAEAFSRAIAGLDGN
jgi:fused signal recognition particle receptor